MGEHRDHRVPEPVYADTEQYSQGLDYSDTSDVYLAEGNSSLSEPIARYPVIPNSTKRSLEARVRDYTGIRPDDRLEHPAGSSSGRSSDSRSPFLEGNRTGHRRGHGNHGSTSPHNPVDWGGMVLSDRNYETVPPAGQQMSFGGNTIWETTLDQDYLNYGAMQNTQRPDLVMANTHSTKSFAHKKSFAEDSGMGTYCPAPGESLTIEKEKVIMPGFPVQTLNNTHHPTPPYSPSREKTLVFGRPCLFNCSWRLVAISLTFLTLLLASVIVYYGAVKHPQQLPPLPDSVIDANGLRDSNNALNCPPPVTNTQHEQPTGGFHNIHSVSGLPNTDSKVSIIPEQWFKESVEPYSFWRGTIDIHRPAVFQFNITLIEGGSDIAIFGRNMETPSVTQYDWVEYIGRVGGSRLLSRRSVNYSPALQGGHHSVSRYLTDGSWYVAIYNDHGTKLQFGMVVDEQERGEGMCPNNCSRNGQCLPGGKCDCEIQWTGKDCSTNICPVLCSGHGAYGGGYCHCYEGWKGDECSIMEQECEVADCSQQGSCDGEVGVCICDPGWKGLDCTESDCLDRECSNHGTCAEGKCFCDVGWTGEICDEKNDRIFKCLPDCSGHGTFDLSTGHCICQGDWTGLYCNITICNLNCGLYGKCEKNQCHCEEGWSGTYCDVRTCNSRCEEHGQCMNGTCVCQQGWNGRHCSMDACSNGCSGHGECKMEVSNNEYSCDCRKGWSGKFCEQQQELNCEDEIDNDKDGLTDCGDSNCCGHPACKENIMCVFFADPVDVLLRKPPPTASASFFKRVQFLIEGDKSVQSYSKQESYDERRAAVIRGRVITTSGEGIIGVRVSVDRSRGASNYGFTLTRPGGWFDMLVNGGGAVTLQFQRSPFKPLTRTSYIPWNQIYVIEPVIMAFNGGNGIPWKGEVASLLLSYSEPCVSHDYNSIKPILITSHQQIIYEDLPPKRAIFAESGVLQESVKIPGSNIFLIYHSSSASSAYSTIHLRLTPQKIPEALFRIHVKIIVAGVVFKKTFEGEENLLYTYAWNKRNVYNQKVYTDSDVRVSVGYQYRDCATTIWETQTTKLAGFQVDISDIGGWNINIHHHYNTFDGILQKGDGTRKDLSKETMVVVPLMGLGNQRDFQCEKTNCEGNVSKTSLLNVVTMTTGPDGSVYVGDYNLIRKIDPKGNVFTILHFSSSQGSFLYEITISPADDSIYMTNSERHQVWRILKLDGVKTPASNWEAVVGTGERCIPGDKDKCGDGGLATQATLSFPKGLAISVDKTMYISDGKNIRVVTQNGQIETIIGSHSNHNQLKPIGCESPYLANEVELHWPTKLALSPLDSTLHIVDDSQVIRLTQDKRLQVLAGKSMRCSKSVDTTQAQTVKFGPIIDIGFAQDGSMFIAEKTEKKWTNIQKILHSGQIEHILGDPNLSTCHCNAGNCSTCSDSGPLIANQVLFKVLSAFAVSPEGNLHVADNEALKIFSLNPFNPIVNEQGHYDILDPLVQELYTFNKFGQHLETKWLNTKHLKYQFEYSKSSGFGKLLKVSDSIENKILLQRDYTQQVQTIKNTFGQKYSTRMNSLGKLESFQIGNRKEIKFQYGGTDFLLESISKSNGDLYSFNYNEHGKIIRAVAPTGESLTIRTDKSCLLQDKPALCIHGFFNDIMVLNKTSASGSEEFMHGSECRTKLKIDKLQVDLSFSSCASMRINLREVPTSSLGIPNSIMRIPGDQHLLRGQKVSSLTLKTSWEDGQLRGNTILMNKTHKVGSSIFENDSSRQIITDAEDNIVLETEWNMQAGLSPTSWNGINSISCNSSFDSHGRVLKRICDQSSEEFTYNSKDSNLHSRSQCNGQPTSFLYENQDLIREVILPSGRKLTYFYDSFGGLEQVMLPRGARHSFWTQQSFHYQKFYHKLPGSSDPYTTYRDLAGNLLQVRPPGNTGIVIQRYNSEGRILAIVGGDRTTHFKYNKRKRNELSQIEHTHGINMKINFQYDNGLLKEQRTNFDSKSALGDTKLSYEYDQNMNIIRIKGRIGGQSIPKVGMFYGKINKKVLSALGYFQIESQTMNGTIISDGNVKYERSNNFYQLSINNKEVFNAKLIYNECEKIKESQMLLKRPSGFYKQTKHFSYDDDGQLLEVKENKHVWKYDYDSNGNMVKLLFGKTKHIFSYDDWDQLIKYNQAVLSFDRLGRLILDYKKQKYLYGINNLLREVVIAREDRKITYFYDQQDRLVGRKDSKGNITQFHYARLEKPYLVTHIFYPRENQLTSLVYDNQDMLIFAQSNRKSYYVVCDQVGAPFIFFSNQGDLVKELSRGPFGHVTYDSYPGLKIPIGIFGGIQDDDTGLVHIQQEGRRAVYDPFTGSYLVPDRINIETNIHHPELFLLYRMNGNDPANLLNRRNHDYLATHKKTVDILSQSFPIFNLQSVAKLTGFPLENKGLTDMHFKETTHGKSNYEESSALSLVSNKLLGFQQYLGYLQMLFGIQTSQLVETNFLSNFEFSRQDPPFGKFIIFNKVKERVNVISGPGSNQIYQNVFTSVLNNSFIVDFETSSHGMDSFYFTKSDTWRTSDDIAQLRRLGSKVNLTVHENQFDASKTMDVKVHLPSTIINIRYGSDPLRERARLLRHSARVVIRKAWATEKDISDRNGQGKIKWTPRELKQLRTSVTVEGWEVVYRNPPSKYPELATDIENVMFIKSGKKYQWQ